jgi:hypothetical protein
VVSALYSPPDLAFIVNGSEAMDPTTINANTFKVTLTNGGAAVPGIVRYSAGPSESKATFTPDPHVTPNTSYTVTITTGAKDLSFNPLAGPYVFTVTTPP